MTLMADTSNQAFYINLLVGAVCAPVYLFLLPSMSPTVGQTLLKDRLKRIDFVGTVIFVGSFTCGILAISFGGVLYPWNSGRIIGLFVAAGVLLILFFVQQLLLLGTTEQTRLFPIHFLRRPIMMMMFVATACAATTVFIPIYFIPLYFQFIRNDKALKAGIRLLPYIAFTVASAMANGIGMSKKPYYMPWYVFSGSMCIIGSALLYAVVDEKTRAATIWGFSIILGVGGGAFMQLGFTVIQSKITDKAEIPLSVGFCTLAQLSGPVVALAIANAVFLNKATTGIRHLVPEIPQAAIQSAISGVSGRKVQGVPPELQPEVLHIVVRAIQSVYILPLTAGAVTLIMALFMKREKLSIAKN
jgi:MFS family permease